MTQEDIADEETVEISADPEAATLVGVVWDVPGDEVPAEPQVRTKRDGAWTDWEPMELAAGDVDPGTAEAEGAATATEPYNVTGAEDIQVRRAADDADLDAEVTVVESKATAMDGDVVQASMAAGAVGAGAASNTGAYEAQNVAAQPTIVSRKGWGANESLKPCTPTVRSDKPQALTIHHTAGSNSYSASAAPGIVRGILSYHTQSLKWCDVGYNFLIDRYGTIYEGRSGGITKSVVGAHAGGFNARTVGISVMGTFTTSTIPGAARTALVNLSAWRADQAGINPTGKVTLTSAGSTRYPSGRKVSLPTIFGHRDVSTTECPGRAFYGQLGGIRTAVKSRVDASAFPVGGAIKTYLDRNSSVASKLGAATTAERRLATNGGVVQSFRGGAVHWSSATGAYATWGGIQKEWRRLGWEAGALGYPTSTESCGLKGGGCFQSFQNGSIHWTSSTDARATFGAVRAKWRAAGWESGALGYPTTHERRLSVRGGAVQSFQGGAIHWSSKTGARITQGAIQAAWKAQKWEAGRLGYPTTDEFKSGSLTRQNFEGGYITWQSGKGTTVRYT